MSTVTPAEVITTLPAVPSGGGLLGAIAAVMNEVHVVAKRGENEFHRYRYATMGDILREITPLLGRHGIVIFQSETGRAMFDEDNVIAIEYAFTVAHASGEIWPHAIKQTGVSTCRNSKGGWDDKSLNKCHTAARKYFLLALFQIPTGDEEDDADRGKDDRRPAPAVVPAVVHRVRSIAPEYVVPPPSCDLKQGGIAERAISQRYEQAVRSVGPSQPFPASEAGKAFSPRFRAQAAGYNERNPPPDEVIPDGPGEAARALNRELYPLRDELPAHSAPPKQPAKVDGDTGIPDFLDRRRKATTGASYLDLVGVSADDQEAPR
jgi:ERF superfamily protein